MRLEGKGQLVEGLLLLLLRGDPMKLQEGLGGLVLLLLVKKLERPGQVLVDWEGSESSPGGFESA